MFRLRAERLRRGWSQTRVAMLTGISGPDLSAIESRRRYAPPGWRRRLSKVSIRAAVIETLTSLEVRGAAALTDAALRLARESSPGDLQGQSLEFDEVAPAAEVVDGAALLAHLVTLYRRFVIIEAAAADALALLTVNSHVHEAADCSPIAAVTSPTMRCGKTTLLRLVTRLARRALPTSNISAAALFRAIEKCAPALIIDEADSFVAMNEELRGILNAGHTRDLAFVVRTVGDDHDPGGSAPGAPNSLD
jgi:transcriptional regulator with XRE-family HTH domain